MKSNVWHFCALLALFHGAHAALATIIIVDQQNLVGNMGTGPIHDTGQSFTPLLSAINVVDVSLSTINPGSTVTIRLDLFSGAGFGGTLLGSSSPVTATEFGFPAIEFNFASLISVVPGSIYTFRMAVIGGGGYEELRSLANPYAGGTAFTPDGTAFPESDLVFAEGLGSVPDELSTLWLALPLLGLVAFRRLPRVTA